MFYALAKIAATIALPSSLGLIAIILGLLLLGFMRYQKLGIVLAALGVTFLVVAGFSPLANWLIYPLEQRFAHVKQPGPDHPVTGIIILGGFEDARVTQGRPGLGLNESVERLTEGLRMAHKWPNAKVVFTGGAVERFKRTKSAAGPIGEFLVEMGVSTQRILLEGQSRDTYENALFTRKLVKPKADDTWVLVTSAYHMPRAMGVFRQAGFNIIAAPVDFRTRDASDRTRFFSRASRGLMRLDVVAKEWIGLMVYWVTGRTPAIFPAPRSLSN